MNTVISATVISVLGAGLIGMLFHYLRDLSTRFSSLELAVANLDTKVTGGFQALGERIDRVYDVLLEHGERLTRLEEAVRGNGLRLVRLEEAVKDHGERLTRLEEAVKGNGERLSRIEDMLGVDPPAEAA